MSFLGWRRRKPQERAIGTQRVEALGATQLSGSAPEYIAAVRANEETDFSFKVGGILELVGSEPHRDWQEGSAVQAGAILARLQQGDFKNALASAKAAADEPAVPTSQPVLAAFSDDVQFIGGPGTPRVVFANAFAVPVSGDLAPAHLH